MQQLTSSKNYKMDCIDVLIKKLRGDGANAQKDKINEDEDDEMVMYKASIKF